MCTYRDFGSLFQHWFHCARCNHKPQGKLKNPFAGERFCFRFSWSQTGALPTVPYLWNTGFSDRGSTKTALETVLGKTHTYRYRSITEERVAVVLQVVLVLEVEERQRIQIIHGTRNTRQIRFDTTVEIKHRYASSLILILMVVATAFACEQGTRSSPKTRRRQHKKRDESYPSRSRAEIYGLTFDTPLSRGQGPVKENMA